MPNIWVSSSTASCMEEADKPEGGNLACLQNHNYWLLQNSKILKIVFCTFIYFKSQTYAIMEGWFKRSPFQLIFNIS